MHCAQTASQGSILWRLLPHPMYVRHACQTRTLQKQVVVRPIVRAILDIRGTTVLVAMRVWPANTKQALAASSAVIAWPANIPQ